MAAFRAHLVLWLIPSSLAQYYCCIDGKCPYKDPTPSGFDCFQSESKCNSQCGGGHDTCWGCQDGKCTPCGCEGVCPGSGDFPFQDKAVCDERCAGPQATWLCAYGCQTSQQCFTMAQCEEAPAGKDPCDVEKAKQSCPGTLIQKFKPHMYTDNRCPMDAKSLIAGNTGCTGALEIFNSTEDPCHDDPDGSKHKCYSDCTACFNERGAGSKWCQPPAGGGFGCDTGYDCKYLLDDQSCNFFCGCSVKPTPGTCPHAPDDAWRMCRDPAKGGGPQCVWCQDQHTCIASDGKVFPKGFDPSCGDPTTPPLESPEPNTQKTNLCVYKCADDVAEYVCLDDGCPDTYGDCSRAFWYNVAADGCGELGSHTYDSGGEKVGDQTDAHVSINGNAMHQVALALVKSRRLATLKGEVLEDVSVDDIANGIKDLEDKGLSMAEKGLCSWMTEGAGSRLCGFLVNSPVVQWVNDKLLNLPFASQVTHQLATKAAGASGPVAKVVVGALTAVAKVVSTAGDIINACKNAAVNVAHTVLHWFGWMDRSVFSTITGERGRLSLPPTELKETASGVLV
eukprot:Skav212222  [mRNA]  locus=scaffold862:162645:164336:- [translate_table: standard]